MRYLRPIVKAVKNYRHKLSYRARFLYTRCHDSLDIDSNSVLLESFHGDEMTGAPFYLLKELYDNLNYSSLNLYVVANTKSISRIQMLLENQFDDYSSRITIVLRHSDEYCRLLASCKYLINNVSFPAYFIKRREQVYFNTWHGTAIKALGRSMTNASNTIGNVQRNFLMSDYLLCPNRIMLNVFQKDYMIDIFYEGKYVFLGYPQNAVLLSSNPVIKSISNKRHTVSLIDKKVVIYMPTWRQTRSGVKTNTSSLYLTHALFEFERRLDNDTVVLCKPHHLDKDKIKWDDFQKVYPFPDGFETYQILSLADLLITDYSSVMFDFLDKKREILLYTYDEQEYQSTRSMYQTISQLPFWHTDNIVELCDHVNEIPIGCERIYDECIAQYSPYEDRYSAEKLCDLIINGNQSNLQIEDGNLYHNTKENVLIYAGALLKNGITASLNGLLNTIDLTKRNYILLFYRGATSKNISVINNLPEGVRYLVIQGNQSMTIAESIARFMYYRLNMSFKIVNDLLDRLYTRERDRIAPRCSFDTVIHFTGYERQIINILNAFTGKKYIYVHNDMMAEYKTRHNFHMLSNKKAYSTWDGVAVVRETLVSSMHEAFEIPFNRLYVVHNCNDIKGITTKSNEPIEYDADTVASIDKETLEDIYSQHKGTIFINIGRYSPEKGQMRLIRAFERYAQTNEPESKLVIVGGHGKSYRDISSYVAENCAENVILIKSLSNPYPLLKRSDAMIIASVYEGLPMVLFEALILKKPVISTDLQGVSGLLSEGYGLTASNSEYGLYEGMLAFEKLAAEDIAVFDAISFNEHAVKEFETLFNDGGGCAQSSPLATYALLIVCIRSFQCNNALIISFVFYALFTGTNRCQILVRFCLLRSQVLQFLRLMVHNRLIIAILDKSIKCYFVRLRRMKTSSFLFAFMPLMLLKYSTSLGLSCIKTQRHLIK